MRCGELGDELFEYYGDVVIVVVECYFVGYCEHGVFCVGYGYVVIGLVQHVYVVDVVVEGLYVCGVE